MENKERKPGDLHPLNYRTPHPPNRRRLFEWSFFAAFPFTWIYLALVFYLGLRLNNESPDWIGLLVLVSFATWCFYKRSQEFGKGIFVAIVLAPVLFALIFVIFFGICYVMFGGGKF